MRLNQGALDVSAIVKVQVIGLNGEGARTFRHFTRINRTDELGTNDHDQIDFVESLNRPSEQTTDPRHIHQIGHASEFAMVFPAGMVTAVLTLRVRKPGVPVTESRRSPATSRT